MRKPPKLRARVGEFLMSKGQLYCVVLIWRSKAEPSVWYYHLEERRSTGNPSTLLSLACASMQGSDVIDGAMIWEPVNDVYEAFDRNRDRYAFGDSIQVTSKDIINDFERVG